LDTAIPGALPVKREGAEPGSVVVALTAVVEVVNGLGVAPEEKGFNALDGTLDGALDAVLDATDGAEGIEGMAKLAQVILVKF
jgi:hypothetical protein